MSRLARLLASRRGAGAIEFAVLLPVMLLLFCGVVELTNLYTVNRKVVLAAQSCADLVTQERSVDAARLEDIARAAELALEPHSTAGLSFRISSVRFDPQSGSPALHWQHTVGGFGGSSSAAPTTSAAGLGLPGESVVIVDLSYVYSPVFQNLLPDGLSITELAAARPRRVRVIECTGGAC